MKPVHREWWQSEGKAGSQGYPHGMLPCQSHDMPDRKLPDRRWWSISPKSEKDSRVIAQSIILHVDDHLWDGLDLTRSSMWPRTWVYSLACCPSPCNSSRFITWSVSGLFGDIYLYIEVSHEHSLSSNQAALTKKVGIILLTRASMTRYLIPAMMYDGHFHLLVVMLKSY